MLLLLAAVRDGLGMSCLPRYLCDKEPALIRAFNVPEEHCADLCSSQFPSGDDVRQALTSCGLDNLHR